MSFDSAYIYTALNVSAITTLLSTGGLINSRLIPSDFVGDKTINFYLSGPYSGVLEWDEYGYTLNCRAETDGESLAIAQAVFTQLNRAGGSGYFTTCTVLGTIPPQDDTDVFNTPVDIILKSRN